MKTMIMAAALAFSIFGSTSAREVVMSADGAVRRTSIVVEQRVAQSHSNATPCTTKYVTTTNGVGNTTTRKSVDCAE